MRRDERYAHSRMVAPIGVAAIILVLGVAITLGLLLAQRHQSDRLMTLQAREVAASLGDSLERQMGLLAVRSEALAGLVEIHPEIARKDLERFAARLTGDDEAFRNLALAPDDVISFVHPLEGNSEVLGVDIAGRAGQGEAVRRVRRERRTILAGPINLVQGGIGLASRSPVLLPAAGGVTAEPRYWGMAVLVIDYDAMLDRAGLDRVQQDYDVGLRGRDASGPEGEIFHGRPDLFDAPRAAVKVEVPGGSWLLVAQPKEGWKSAGLLSNPLLPLGIVVSLLIALLGYRIASDRVAIRELAMSDPLTRLPNRRHVQWQLRDSLDQLDDRVHCGAIVLIDFDDFKPVNDLLGHRIGDEVLRVISARMRASIGPTDFLARIGGDEFLLIHTNSEPVCRDEVETTATRLLAAIAQTVLVEDHTIGVRASMGIALFPEHGRDPTILRECADRALYRAKSDGGNRAIVYRRGTHDIDRTSGNHRALPE